MVQFVVKLIGKIELKIMNVNDAVRFVLLMSGLRKIDPDSDWGGRIGLKMEIILILMKVFKKRKI